MKHLPTLIAVVLAFVLGWLIRRPSERVEYVDRVVVDTLFVTERVVEEKPVYVEVLKEVHDTCVLETIRHDTVSVIVPIEYRHERFEQGEVYYHGYNAGIDSLIAFKHTQIINVERIIAAPRWGIDINAGMGASGKGIVPYFGIGIGYRILPLQRKRERNIDYD